MFTGKNVGIYSDDVSIIIFFSCIYFLLEEVSTNSMKDFDYPYLLLVL